MCKGIIIHCSDSTNDRVVTAKDIHRWHKERGFDGIGYHYVIRRDGGLEHGRPEYWTGAHAQGYNDFIGICLVGRDEYTDAQWKTLKMLLLNLSLEHGFKKENIKGHYEVNPNKTCPNFDVRKFVEGLQ